MVAVLVIVIWIVCGIVTYGIMRAICPEEVEDAEIILMFMCLTVWPLFLVLMICRVVLKRLVLIGEFVGGFLRGFIKKDEE